MSAPPTSVLISGAGVAGLTLAYWLHQRGFAVTVVEKAAALRRGGYMIDFWGAGFDVAEKMGLLDELLAHHIDMAELTFVNEADERVGGFNVPRLRMAVSFRHYNILRSALAAVLYRRVKDNVEILFDTSIENLNGSDAGVTATLSDGKSLGFDFCIGADGLHSHVRNLCFGEDSDVEHFLGYYTASFTYRGSQSEVDGIRMFPVPGKQAAIYPVGKNTRAAFFLFESEELNVETCGGPEALLRREFGDLGWRCPELLENMDSANDYYFDAVSQIRMPKWSQGRIGLVGDACQSVSLVGGQGAALAMAGAYILAQELARDDGARGGGQAESLVRYESALRPEIERKQRMAEGFAKSFVPKTPLSLWTRNKLSNAVMLPGVSKWFIKRYMADNLKLDFGNA